MKQEADPMSAVFGALADPTRRAILARLADGDANVAELAAPFAISQPAISRHLKVLERAGLVSRQRQATARLSHLEAEPMREAASWLMSYRAYWSESFDRLDELLDRLQGGPRISREPHRPGEPPEDGGNDSDINLKRTKGATQSHD